MSNIQAGAGTGLAETDVDIGDQDFLPDRGSAPATAHADDKGGDALPYAFAAIMRMEGEWDASMIARMRRDIRHHARLQRKRRPT